MGIFSFLSKEKKSAPKILGMIQVFGELKIGAGLMRDAVVIDLSSTKVVCLSMPDKQAYTLGANIFKGSRVELKFTLPYTGENIDITGKISKDPEKGDVFPETEVLYIDIKRIQPKHQEAIDYYIEEQKQIILNSRMDKRRILMDSIKCNVPVTFFSEEGFGVSGGKIRRIGSWGALCEVPYTDMSVPHGTQVDLTFHFLKGLVVHKASVDWIISDHNEKTTFISFRFRKLKPKDRMLFIKFASVKRWQKLKSNYADV